MRRRVLAVVLGLAVAPLAVEGWVRVAEPDARTQIIRAEPGLEVLGEGQDRYWRGDGAEGRENPDCQAERTVHVHGSSILYGTGVGQDSVWSNRIPGVCVHNFAGPGYGVEAKLARLRTELPRQPDLVVWEVWANDANRFVWVGDQGYSLNPGMPLDDGVPSVFGLPSGLNAVLFRTLRSYELMTLTQAKPLPAQADRRGPLDAMLALVGDTPLLVVIPPVLDKPFGASIDQPTDFAQETLAWADERGVRTVRLAELLEDQQVEAVRLDPCCHYNEAGHAVLAERLAPFFEDLR